MDIIIRPKKRQKLSQRLKPDFSLDKRRKKGYNYDVKKVNINWNNGVSIAEVQQRSCIMQSCAFYYLRRNKNVRMQRKECL